MVEHIATWFRQGLGARIDALQLALEDLNAGRPEAEEALKRLAFSVSAPAKGLSLQSICEAAEKVKQSGGPELPTHVRALIALLRKEAAEAAVSPATVLLVGGDPDFSGAVAEAVQTPAREVLRVTTGQAAKETLARRDIVCVVLSLFLPDMDGRTLFTHLQEDARTAAIPVLLLAAGAGDTVRKDTLLNASENMLDSEDPAAVADWIKMRLRRAHAKLQEARRDRLTGLLNRPAFRESFQRISQECHELHEPVCLAAISLEGCSKELEGCDPRAREEVLHAIGATLSRSLRVTDLLGRWGQYQFVALFPGQDQHGGGRAVGKVIDILSKQKVRGPNDKFFNPVLSAGVALVSPGMSLDDAATEADGFCFQAASGGGNRVVTEQSEPAEAHPKRVLLMMHDEKTTPILKQLFGKDGFEVTHVNEANGAVPTGEGQHLFHLIIIDENVPNKGGFEALREVRSQPRNARLPVVMLISNNTEENIVRALELGANDYIIRPFSPFTFMHRMRRLLSRGVATEAPPDRARSVLLVDDDVKALILAATALHQRGGFKVHLARGAEDGLKRFDEIKPEVLALAVDMEGMDGLEMLGKLPEDVDPAQVAVILTVAAGETRDFKELLAAGIRGPIPKPFNPLTFGEEVENLIGAARGQKPTPEMTAHFNAEIQKIVARPA